MDEEDQQIHVPDVIDQASALEMRTTQLQLAHLRSKCKQVRLPRADGSYEEMDCEDCGGEIPEERMKVSIRNNLCVYCLTARERFGK